MWLRNQFYKNVFIYMGTGSNICDGVTITEPSKVSIGKRVSIHPNCWIQGSGGIKIGSYVGISSGVKIISTIHNFTSTDTPIKEQGLTEKPVEIGDNVWIGANAIIHGGTNIGHGSIISAGAIVSGDIEPYSIIAGNPGRLIKVRSNN